MTAEEFLLIVVENAAEIEELAAEGGIDMGELEDAIQAIEDEFETGSILVEVINSVKEVLEVEDNGSSYSVYRFGYGFIFWFIVLVFKLN